MKKSARIPEIIIWLFFSMIVCFGYAFSFLTYAARHTQASGFHVALSVSICLLLAGAGVIYVKMPRPGQCFFCFSKTEWIFLEGGILALLLIGGYILRFSDHFYGIWQSGLEDTFFQYAQVVPDRAVYANPHLISGMYVQMLHIACLFFGNIYEIGVSLQFALQLLGVLVWYMALRKLLGRVEALFFVFGAMLLPDSIRHSVQCDPTMLLFLIYGCTVFCMAYYAKSHISGKWDTFLEALLGVMTAFCVFADISGLLMLFVLAYALNCKHRLLSGSFWPWSKCIPVVTGLFAGLFLTVILQSELYGIRVVDAVRLQSRQGLAFTFPDKAFWHRYAARFDMQPAFLPAVLVILAYWFIRTRKVLTYTMGAVLYLFAVQFLQLDLYMEHDFLIYMLLLVLTGMTWKRYFQAYKTEEPVVTVVHFEEQPVVEVPPISEKAPAIFMPKSLTIPKRTPKAKIDYEVEVQEEQLHFDVPVEENADFDVD